MSDHSATEIIPYSPDHKEALITLSLRAWAPVFEKMKRELPVFIYDSFYPDGWKERQSKDVAAFLVAEGAWTFVAVTSGEVSGFVGLRLHPDDQMGEVYILATDPGHQRQGIASALISHVEDRMRQQGMKISMVETSGDSGHLPARQTYEAAGYGTLPVARFFKQL
ncbi:GNAT family N-acetyltransferase [Roseibium sp. SCPC15]|uniref:GNAT family N-acetyltransferase n=1 Tax=Roseibium sp. SCP15 TaxID=3141376 RepID=UPI0033360910